MDHVQVSCLFPQAAPRKNYQSGSPKCDCLDLLGSYTRSPWSNPRAVLGSSHGLRGFKVQAHANCRRYPWGRFACARCALPLRCRCARSPGLYTPTCFAPGGLLLFAPATLRRRARPVLTHGQPSPHVPDFHIATSYTLSLHLALGTLCPTSLQLSNVKMGVCPYPTLAFMSDSFINW